MEEAIARGWMNLFARLDGPMHFRFIVQPAIAVLLAVRAGIRDARACRRPFLASSWRREHARERMRQGWIDVGKPFIAAVVVDAVYQTWVHRGIFLLELLATATLLALVPYGLVRGPAGRIAHAFIALRQRRRARGQ
jgi:hypothetical protein